MAMAKSSLFVVVLGILLLVTDVSSLDPPTIAPVSGGNDTDSPVSQSPIQTVHAPSPSPSATASSPSPSSSPPSPSPTEDVSSKNISSSPSPSPEPESDMGNGGGNVTKKSTPPPSSSSSSSKGKKAGIVVGVLIGAVLVGLGGFVYKKRQDNIRRAQYGSTLRREFV